MLFVYVLGFGFVLSLAGNMLFYCLLTFSTLCAPTKAANRACGQLKKRIKMKYSRGKHINTQHVPAYLTTFQSELLREGGGFSQRKGNIQPKK